MMIPTIARTHTEEVLPCWVPQNDPRKPRLGLGIPRWRTKLFPLGGWKNGPSAAD